jgi:TolA-binding protein
LGGVIPHADPGTSTRTAKAGAAPAGDALTRSGSPAYDWDRLERAVGALVAQHETLRKELRTLRDEIGERNHRIRSLEAQLLEANQRRQDTCKRVDELIAQLDQLDAQLENSEPVE